MQNPKLTNRLQYRYLLTLYAGGLPPSFRNFRRVSPFKKITSTYQVLTSDYFWSGFEVSNKCEVCLIFWLRVKNCSISNKVSIHVPDDFNTNHVKRILLLFTRNNDQHMTTSISITSIFQSGSVHRPYLNF